MPIFDTRPPSYKPSKSTTAEWSTFRKGLNLLFRPTELGQDEMAVATNIMLTGSGVPTGRWGTDTYFVANTSGINRGFGTYKSANGTYDDFFALTDEGYLAKKNNASFTTITGQSWPSGTTIRTEQLGNTTYIVSPGVPFTSYAGVNLSVFATISPPTGLTATNFSGASGGNTVSWNVVALSANGGHTTPSTNYVLSNVPSDLTNSSYLLRWTSPSAATMSGHEIYRGQPGFEKFLTALPPGVTTYLDTGTATSISVTAPLTNTTGGVKSNFIKKYKDRLLCVDQADPNKLLISGRYPYHTSFNWADGGGYIYIDPDSGDNITGIEVQPIADKIIVYKNFSSYLVDLQLTQVGNYFLLDPQYTAISTSVGCSNQDAIATVENDTFYFGRNGIYVTGYEPNFLNIIRTNEVSARLRPYLEQLSDDDYTTCCAMYANNKYILSFPLRKEMIVYDRERGCFVGPWQLPYGINHMKKYLDASGTEKLVLGSYEDNTVYNFDKGLNTDTGTAISKTLRTGKNYLGDWTKLAIVRYFYALLRNITGTVNVNVYGEDREGTTSAIKTFTITGTEVNGVTGWGTDMWGTSTWGTTNTNQAVVASDEVTRWSSLFKQLRLIQIEILATSAGSNFELLQLKIEANKQQAGLSSSQRV